MSKCDCYCKTSCAGLSIVASIIIGIIAGMLRFMGVINVTSAFLWVVFGIAIVYLAINLFSSNFSCYCTTNRCLCLTMPVYFVGVLGTIFISMILLGISFSATSFIGAVLFGLLLGFFTLMITSAVCLIKCKTTCSDN